MRRLQQPAFVVLVNGKPTRVSWSAARATDEEPRSGGRVVRVVDEWRAAGRWWTREFRRDYYLLELDGGALVELYREEGEWWMAGVSD